MIQFYIWTGPTMHVGPYEEVCLSKGDTVYIAGSSDGDRVHLGRLDKPGLLVGFEKKYLKAL